MNNQFTILLKERISDFITAKRQILSTVLTDHEIDNLPQTLEIVHFKGSPFGYHGINANFEKINSLPEIKDELLVIINDIKEIMENN